MTPVAGTAFAADLDYNYEQGPPPPPIVRVLPPRPFCGFYRPCFPPLRLGFYGPRFARPYPVVAVPPPYAVGPRPYGHPEGYGYDYDRERYERSERHVSRYGYEHPRAEGREPYGEPRRDYGPRDLGPRERYDRYGEGRPYADPLGHDRRGGYDRYERERGPEGRGEPDFDRRG